MTISNGTGAAFAALALAISIAPTAEAKRSPADQAFHEMAVKACKGPNWPTGTRVFINYTDRWFRCQEPKSYRSN